MATLLEDRRARIAALGYDYAAQPKAAVTTCNLCGGAEFVTLTHRDRYGYPAAGARVLPAAGSCSSTRA